MELKIGDRFHIGEDYGTVLFSGEVVGNSGIWLGVEWDNGAKRGKHSGERNGVQYFTCHIPNAGSFLRPSTPGIIAGTDFSTALIEKYVDNKRTNGQESVILGSSNGAIVVEAPRMDGVRARISQIERLRRISLDYYDVSTPGDLENIARLCPSVQSLDLSRTLLGSWEDIMDIARQMPKIKSLELNFNRLCFTRSPLARHFLDITHLRLNSTMITWLEACRILVYFPKLRDLQLGCNQLRRLDHAEGATPILIPFNLLRLNLDSNKLDDWASIMLACADIPSLSGLMLPSNSIGHVPFHSDDLRRPVHLKNLSLMDNPITGWNDIDAIATWFPSLNELSISLEPLKLPGSSSTSSRDLVAARLPELTRLNGSEITERDRSDAELFYLSWIFKHENGSEKDIETRHPRWKELSSKHQTSREVVKPVIQNLENDMITVNVVRIRGLVSKDRSSAVVPPTTELRVLPTMSAKVFIMKLKKSMRIKTQIVPEQLWIVSSPEQDSDTVKIVRRFDGDILRDIAWSGVEDGCFVGLVDT